MNTFIIMWDPAAAGLDYKGFKEWFTEPLDECIHVAVSDWKKARVGDRIYMVRTGGKGRGGKGNGIVMSGYFISEPYSVHYEFLKGQKVYCVDVQPDYLFDTNRIQTLTDVALTENLPGFDWQHGSSGKVLDKTIAAKLESMWEQFLHDNAVILHCGKNWRTARNVFKKSPIVELYKLHGEDGYIGVDAEFYGGGLYVSHYGEFYDDEMYLEELPAFSGSEPITSVKDFSIEITSLRKAFGVKDNEGVASRLRKDFMGIDGKRLLLEFAMNKGCRLYEIEFAD